MMYDKEAVEKIRSVVEQSNRYRNGAKDVDRVVLDLFLVRNSSRIIAESTAGTLLMESDTPIRVTVQAEAENDMLFGTDPFDRESDIDARIVILKNTLAKAKSDKEQMRQRMTDTVLELAATHRQASQYLSDLGKARIEKEQMRQRMTDTVLEFNNLVAENERILAENAQLKRDNILAENAQLKRDNILAENAQRRFIQEREYRRAIVVENRELRDKLDAITAMAYLGADDE